MDTGNFATDVSQLTIEYSGDEVVCTTTQINPDSSVYLSGCTVAGRNVEGYTYGKDKAPVVYDEYAVGDEITYNGVNYYVLKDSNSSKSNVTLLKAAPLTTDEVNLYGGVGTENNVVNKYAIDDAHMPNVLATASNQGGYGGMAYYENETCYYKDSTGYNVRLATFDELSALGFEFKNMDTSGGVNMQWVKTDDTPSWVYSGAGMTGFWTMSEYDDSSSKLYVLYRGGYFSSVPASIYNISVRPVIVLSKSAL